MDLRIRPWQMSDLENLVKYANNPNVAQNLTDRFPHPYTDGDGEAFLKFVIMENPIQTFAIEAAGEAIGAIGIHPQADIYKKNAELGYWLG